MMSTLSNGVEFNLSMWAGLMETNTREDVIAELRAALVELEGGAGLSLFVGGHGLMSRRRRSFDDLLRILL